MQKIEPGYLALATEMKRANSKALESRFAPDIVMLPNKNHGFFHYVDLLPEALERIFSRIGTAFHAESTAETINTLIAICGDIAVFGSQALPYSRDDLGAMSAGGDVDPPVTVFINAALNRAMHGKGRERHADSSKFEDQVLFRIMSDVGAGFALGQAMKKIHETSMSIRRSAINKRNFA